MKNKAQFYLGVLIVIVSLFVFEYFGLSGSLLAVMGKTLRPLRVFASSSLSLVETPFFIIKRSMNAARRIQMLEVRYSEVLAQLGDLKGLEIENQELRSLLENTDRQAREVIISAPVVSQVGPSVGAGRKDGAEVGDLVFLAQTLVGVISAVDENFSEVNLIYEKDFQPLAVQNSEGIKGIVQGDGRGVIFTEVLPEQNPALESRLVTTGQVGVEKDLFVGQVGKLISGHASPVKTYQVLQLVDFHQSRVVEIYK